MALAFPIRLGLSENLSVGVEKMEGAGRGPEVSC